MSKNVREPRIGVVLGAVGAFALSLVYGPQAWEGAKSLVTTAYEPVKPFVESVQSAVADVKNSASLPSPESLLRAEISKLHSIALTNAPQAKALASERLRLISGDALESGYDFYGSALGQLEDLAGEKYSDHVADAREVMADNRARQDAMYAAHR